MLASERTVVVVGGGPAGSTAAREIAARGHEVLLLERHRFPRDKPCGGGVTVRAAALLPFDLTPVVEQVVDGAMVRLGGGSDFVRDAGRPLTYMTQRSRLDAFLVEKAQEAGVEFRDGERVRDVTRHADGSYVVRTDRGAHRCRVVVGADGANGVVAGSLGFEPPMETAVAIEADIRCPEGIPSWIEGRVALALSVLPGGYGWVFPKAGHINVGVGGRTQVAGRRLRQALDALCRAYGLEPQAMTGVRGHRLPMQRPGAPVALEGAALVGDSASLLDPLSGEGIHAAILSGAALAPCVDDYVSGAVSDLDGYGLTLARELVPELVTSRQLMEVFHVLPSPAVSLMRRSDRFWRHLCEIVCEEAGYDDLVRSRGPWGPPLLRLAAGLARALDARWRASR